MTRRSATRRAILTTLAPAALVLAGCGSDDDAEPATSTIPGLVGAITCSAGDGAKGPGAGTKAVGFVLAGAKADVGYNQAIYAGAEALRVACPDLKVLVSEAVPDPSEMTRAAERMIGQGARIIFSTSPAYSDAAVALAKKHADVVVLQQGAAVEPPLPPNVGTYDGSAFETVYLAGVVAATTTASRKLGFVAASADPPALRNVNAFALGARSVDPKITTHAAFTGSRCEPADQLLAVGRLLKRGADVLAQEQDCTSTVIRAAETDGKQSIGFHFDARSLAPEGWLTGVESNWAPLFGAIVSSVQQGEFTTGQFHDNVVIGFTSTKIPPATRLARYGPAIDVNTARRVSDARAEIIGGRSPFSGPVVDRTGKVRVARGRTATSEQLATMSYLVEGVVGTIPK